jgi:hypothetical protein
MAVTSCEMAPESSPRCCTKMIGNQVALTGQGWGDSDPLLHTDVDQTETQDKDHIGEDLIATDEEHLVT